MPTIDSYLNQILEAEYGEEVRDSIYNSIKMCYEDATGSEASNSNLALLISEIGERLDSYESAYNALNNYFKSNNAYVRIGSLLICYGTANFKKPAITEAEGNIFVGSMEYHDHGKATEDWLELKTTFPACFTKEPAVYVGYHGRFDNSWVTKVNADLGGISKISVAAATSKTPTTFPTRYIAVGRCDGTRALGARVASQALSYGVGEQYSSSDGQTWQEYFLNQYNNIPSVVSGSNTQRSTAAWCSEFACVSAYKAGVDVGNVDYFPYFASAYQGLTRFQACSGSTVYVRTGNASDKTSRFCLATSLSADSDSFTYTIDSSKTYVPRVGDILFTKSSSGTAPSHTCIVCDCDYTEGEEFAIYTIEGNVPLYEASTSSSGTSYSEKYRTMYRRKRDMFSTNSDGDDTSFGENVLAVVNVGYPTNWEESGTGGGTGGSTVTDNNVSDTVSNLTTSGTDITGKFANMSTYDTSTGLYTTDRDVTISNLTSGTVIRVYDASGNYQDYESGSVIPSGTVFSKIVFASKSGTVAEASYKLTYSSIATISGFMSNSDLLKYLGWKETVNG